MIYDLMFKCLFQFSYHENFKTERKSLIKKLKLAYTLFIMKQQKLNFI